MFYRKINKGRIRNLEMCSDDRKTSSRYKINRSVNLLQQAKDKLGDYIDDIKLDKEV